MGYNCLTNNLRVNRHRWHFYDALVFVITLCVKLVLALSSP
ncbi:DUF3265 domain-containing protein [Vibrio vulnificus]|nr:DUF3265 domain-containing protein [Vibrio vulnificus]RZQ90299.1 DUF3265 domain-containing protein [Vibrio vulnificus]